MRELNDQELTEVTGGLLGQSFNPAIGPLVSGITVETVISLAVDAQLAQVNVRDYIDPAGLHS